MWHLALPIPHEKCLTINVFHRPLLGLRFTRPGGGWLTRTSVPNSIYRTRSSQHQFFFAWAAVEKIISWITEGAEEKDGHEEEEEVK